MKYRILILPICFLFAFCSRKSVPPPPPGISNVNVSRGDTMTKADVAAANFTSADRDWAYKANRETILNGTWTLDGILTSDGSWRSAQPETDSAQTMESDSVLIYNSATGETTKKPAKGKTTAKNRKAYYDSAQARLKRDYKAGTAIDTSALPPYQYWNRIPTLMLNPTSLVFSGNTGCNSMSGSFNFGEKDIQFGRNIVTSKMACNEYDENVFLSALKRADSYTVNGDLLELRQGNTLLLTFRKS